MRTAAQLLGGFVMIAGIMAALAAAGYLLWWLVLVVVARLPMIGKRHRHEEWDRLNRR